MFDGVAGSLAENIRYGRPDGGVVVDSLDDVVQAATAANALEFIDRMPGKLNTLAGEQGKLLSGGQKQRIAIARAVIRHPKVGTRSTSTHPRPPPPPSPQAVLPGRYVTLNVPSLCCCPSTQVLLLDEATSALDSESERVVQAALDALLSAQFRGVTTVAIAHRLSTIRNADVIFVLGEGKLVESGSPAALREQPGSLYAKFVQSQSAAVVM